MDIFGKKLELKKNFKKILFFTILILIIYGSYQSYLEKENQKIDEYNFQQLKAIKPILESIPVDARDFYSQGEFIQKYHVNMKPTKNCYYISNVNGDKKYIFWFKLYSNLYRAKYKREYFASPSYDLPYDIICAGYCYDRNMELFLRTISNPCVND